MWGYCPYCNTMRRFPAYELQYKRQPPRGMMTRRAVVTDENREHALAGRQRYLEGRAG